ncbi:hypothetical protein T03_10879 [Trichinella britovi]|uniref:Uncharacterized protein n=2 Tax=Trichinella TaxID=6333 RepID=A0A0V1CZT0_TRIBR|nr:hypothetical protein T05_9866 [Trichinella murrelli]KRX67319.1 hypothetical protein T09_9457 [Trichinella sp. T9]KRY54734.1 hypothetical protein T03_10879 [Trichinella britovi]
MDGGQTRSSLQQQTAVVSKYPLWNSYAVYERLKILLGYVGLRRSSEFKPSR